jgi:hypothetical protein
MAGSPLRFESGGSGGMFLRPDSEGNLRKAEPPAASNRDPPLRPDRMGRLRSPVAADIGFVAL